VTSGRRLLFPPTLLLALLGPAPLLAPGSAEAQPVDVPPTWGGDFWTRPRLTGNWWGLRDDLGKKGVVLDTDLLLTPQAVVSGGKNTAAEFWGNAEYTLNVDTGKLGLWPGGFFKISGQTGFGTNVNDDSGALVPVNVATLVPDLGEEATGLTNLTMTQFLSPKFGLVAGKIFLLDSFQGEFYGNYRTQFQSTALNFPTTAAMVPLSAYGGGLIVIPADWLLLSALAVDPSGTVMNNDISEAFDDGAMVIGSAKVTIKPFGLRGTQSVGGIWSNKSHLSLEQDPTNIARLLAEERFPRLANPGRFLTRILERFRPDLLTPAQPPNREDTTWFVSYSFEQYFWHPGGDQTRGIGMFFNFGASDGKANPIKYSFITGIGGKGIVPGRPHDAFGVGWARTEVSGNFVPFLRDTFNLGLDHGDTVEMYYNAAVTQWLSASLDMQVVSPTIKKAVSSGGGLQDIDTAVIVGTRLYIRF
jgi:porin